MSLQVIKSIDGKDEYVLLPIAVYHALRDQITARIGKFTNKNVSFEPENYIDNPVALARIKAGLTQEELAQRMNVSQAYVSKVESQQTVTAKILLKVKLAIERN
jgi:DNA-binding XRE family transcriptional regulator